MAIKDYSTTAGNNTSISGINIAEGCQPSNINNAIRLEMADTRAFYENATWTDLGHTPVRTGDDTFTINSDVTAFYTVGRRIQMFDTLTYYGTIASAVYSAPNTTVTVTMDSGTLSASLFAVAVSLIDPTNAPIPLTAVSGYTNELSDSSFRIVGSSDATKKVALEVDGLTTETTRTLTVQDKSGILPVIETADISIPATSAGPSSITLAEDTDNGTNTVKIIASSSLTANQTITVPDETGTIITTSTVPSTYLPTGTVIKTLQGIKTDSMTSTSASWVDIATVTITPVRTSNKIMIQASVTGSQQNGTGVGYLRLCRDSTEIAVGTGGGSRIGCFCSLSRGDLVTTYSHTLTFLDSPSSTSAITYRVQVYEVGGTAYINRPPVDPDNNTSCRGVSTITVSEIVG